LIRQIQVQTLDGLIWIEFSMHPMHDPEGNIKYLVPEGRDITDRKRAEEALQEYSERLEEMVEERTGELQVAQEQLVRQEKLAVLGQLAGGVSHELRNPLGVISNAVYFLQMTLSDADETTASPRRIWRSSSSRFSPPRRGASGWDWPSPGSWWRPTGGASRWRVRRGRGAPSL
jgi:signal transduction histidine kinase